MKRLRDDVKSQDQNSSYIFSVHLFGTNRKDHPSRPQECHDFDYCDYNFFH